MKKFLATIMTLVFTISMTMGCFAAESVTEENNTADFLLTMQVGNSMMTVNGTESEIDPGRGTVPVVQDDRTLVPVRAIVEAMGGSVNWDEETQTALLELGGDIITLTLGSRTAFGRSCGNRRLAGRYALPQRSVPERRCRLGKYNCKSLILKQAQLLIGFAAEFAFR